MEMAGHIPPTWTAGESSTSRNFVTTYQTIQFFRALKPNVCLLRFTFNKGEVSFSGRMLETTNYNKSVAAGKMVPTITIAHVEPNDWSMEEMVEGTMNFYDNTNVWLWKLGPEDSVEGQYLAVTDWPQVHEVDPHTLAIKVGPHISRFKKNIILYICHRLDAALFRPNMD